MYDFTSLVKTTTLNRVLNSLTYVPLLWSTRFWTFLYGENPVRSPDWNSGRRLLSKKICAGRIFPCRCDQRLRPSKRKVQSIILA